MHAMGEGLPRSALEEADAEGEPFFRVLGVRCKAESADRVRMGWRLKSKDRVVVKMRVGEDRAEAVRRHKSFDEVRSRVMIGDSANGASFSNHTFPS